LWPGYDEKCAAVVFKMASDLDVILKLVPGRHTVVQAGGNCGVWPRALAPLFERVVTFEPDKRNYECLMHNTREFPNVVAFNYALGDVAGWGTMETPDHETDNCGALQFVPSITDSADGRVPMMRVDALGLDKCDLLYLDIEGFEIPAINGAAETIAKTRPVIALEDKGLSQRYGYAKGDVVNLLEDKFAYRVVQRIHRDVILAPRER
jgi:FkbM family methyltransferase